MSKMDREMLESLRSFMEKMRSDCASNRGLPESTTWPQLLGIDNSNGIYYLNGHWDAPREMMVFLSPEELAAIAPAGRGQSGC
ncbi:MAG: hypothetical protein SFV17_11100 [Candidatus Obscuribacter sp.]|nr:hypothetical protein [Candidatus Obscuribacter sp.]